MLCAGGHEHDHLSRYWWPDGFLPGWGGLAAWFGGVALALRVQSLPSPSTVYRIYDVAPRRFSSFPKSRIFGALRI